MSDANEIWDLWEVDDRAGHSCVIGDGGARGEMLKEADRRNEGRMPGSSIRYIALLRGQEPEFSLGHGLPKPTVPRQSYPALPDHLINHEWRCSMVTAPCTPAAPHGTGARCGYWYTLTLPSNLASDELIRLASVLLRTGVLTAGPAGRRPPAY